MMSLETKSIKSLALIFAFNFGCISNPLSHSNPSNYPDYLNNPNSSNHSNPLNYPHYLNNSAINQPEHSIKVIQVIPKFREEERLLQLHPDYRQDLYAGIIITGPRDYISEIKSSINLIYLMDQQNWQVVRRNITRISLDPPSGISVGDGRYTTNDNLGITETLDWIASEIVHDSWHREYYQRNEPYLGGEGELKCMLRQNQFLAKINSKKRVEINRMLAERYWEYYDNRYW